MINICEHHTCGHDCNHDCDRMMCYVHCRKPKTTDTQGNAHTAGPSQLLVHSKLYTIGDKYETPGLKELAREKFCRTCKDFWEGEDFIMAAEHAYTTTMDEDEGLRMCIKETSIRNKGLLVRPDVKGFLAERPELMYEILINATQ